MAQSDGKKDLRDVGRELFKKQQKPEDAPAEAPAKNADLPAGGSSWVVALAVFGADDRALAEETLAKVQTEGGLPEARLERRGKGLIIALGNYPSPTAEDASRDLQRVRDLRIASDTPYAGATLAPPNNDAARGALPQYELRNAWDSAPGGAKKLYTLQVNAYGRDDRQPPSQSDLKEFRALAEQAVLELRREGEQAYYYHGPRMSLVTIGAFNEKDVGGVRIDELNRRTVEPESIRLQQLRKRYPNGLFNGKGVKEFLPSATQKDKKVERMAPSMLVAIPKAG